MKVIHEYVKNSPDRDQEGWEKKYRENYTKKYGTIDRFRYFLLSKDDSLCKINNVLIEQIIKLREEGLEVNMLDVGCGTGHQIASIAYLCDNCYAFDISQEVINNNKQLNCNVNFMVGDALNHPKIEKPITLILMAGVLYAISDKREIKKQILEQVENSLDDNGIFVFYHRGYLSTFYKINHYIREFIASFKEKEKLSYRMSFYSDEFIQELFDEVGLKILKTDKDDLAFMLTQGYLAKVFAKNYSKSNESYQRLNFLGKIVYGFSKLFNPKLTARSSIFVAIKKSKMRKVTINTEIAPKNYEAVKSIIQTASEGKKIYVYATGGYTNKLLRYFKELSVQGVLSPEKPEIKTTINKIPVIYDKEILPFLSDKCIVFIASRSYEDAIYKRLQTAYAEKFLTVKTDSMLLQHGFDIL